MRVEVQADSPEGLDSVAMVYQVIRPGFAPEEHTEEFKLQNGKTYVGMLPGQEADRLVRLRVHAVDSKQTERWYPSPTDLSPAVSWYVAGQTNEARIGQALVIHTDPEHLRQAEARRKSGPGARNRMRPSPERMMAEQMFALGDPVPACWFEWSIQRDLDPASRKGLQTLLSRKEGEIQAQKESTLESDDLPAALRSVSEWLTKLQESLVTEAKAVLPAEQAEAFATWNTEHNTAKPPGPDDFLRQLLNIEGAWLAISEAYDWTADQWKALRPILQEAVKGRAAQRPVLEKLMQRQGDFNELLRGLAQVEEKATSDLQAVLTPRQFRFLADWRTSHASPFRGPSETQAPTIQRGLDAFVWMEPGSARPELFDFVRVTERTAGYKVRLQKHQPWKDMTTLNVIFETNDRFVLAEPLAFEFYRRAGNPACLTDFGRLTMDGEVLGYHLIIEQVNSAFLRRNHRNTDGDLYKLIWFGGSLEGQHERQNHKDRDYNDLKKLVGQLDGTTGAQQWEIIRNNFNVDEVAAYFAVNMCLSHWDGFFNNYFTYHDRKGTGKWEMYPWDQDKTWGFYDGIPEDQVFFNMPITFGMKGTQPPGGAADFNFGGWWRPPGFFSGPLLANPEFRRRFLARTRQLLETVYTPGVFFPVIDTLADRLRPEVPIRARAIGDDPDEAQARFARNVASLKEHLEKRRAFLLQTDEIRPAVPGQ